jgi:hypothetical protein
MFEAAQFLALCSVALLMASLAIWAGMLRGPLLRRLDGRRAANAGPAQLAMQALLLAFGLSAAAAILAIAGWISP